MNIMRWNPWNEVSALQDRINRLFEDSFPAQRASANEPLPGEWQPVVDVFDTEDAILVQAELPGLKKEDISIEVKENVLTLKGERNEDKEVKAENYYRRERCFGRFQRSFNLPAAVDPEKIVASYKDGVLKVKITKPEEKKPKQIEIKS